MKIKVSHEVPICLLNQGYSDYEYILPHLLDKYGEYDLYMREAWNKGRYIILDNSLHELGKPYEESRLLHWIRELSPNEFIVPDLWEDSKGTIELAKKWMNINLGDKTTKVAVVQARSFDEAAETYSTLKKIGYQKICFSYGANYYNYVSSHPNKDFGKALGRLQVISELYSMGIIKEDHRIHLLGCCLPQEFGWYKDLPIESLDTSNPIMAGIEGIKYKAGGLEGKPKVKIDEVIDKTFDRETLDIINYNVVKFREINNLD